MSEQTESADRRPVAWSDWARLVVATIARIAVFSVVGGLFWATAPALIGWLPTTVMSNSMAPRFFAGDVIVSAPATPAMEMVGRILLVDDPDHEGRLRLHRMAGVAEDGIITRGDANPADDSSHVARAHVRGVAVLRIPFVGMPVLWAKDGHWFLLAGIGIVFAAVLWLTTIDARLRVDPESGRRRTAENGSRLRGRLGPAAVLAGSAGVIALALVVSTGAHAAYAAKASNPTSSWAGASDFACWSTATPADSPYFYYRFNEASGTSATDASGNARTGTMTSVGRIAGYCPGAGSSPSAGFTGATPSYVTPAASAAIAAPGTFSVEAWFQTSSTTGGKIIGFGSSQTGLSSSFDRHVYLSPTGQVVFGVYPNQVKTINSAAGFNDGRWHHVVATLDPSFMSATGGMRLYVDGAQVASDPTTLTAQSYTGYWRIGYDSVSGWGTTTPTSNGFTGNLDNVAVYTTALTAAKVSAHYAVGH